MITTDHEKIRKWIEDNHGRPRILDNPTTDRDKLGISIDFPGPMDERFLSRNSTQETGDWNKFFEIFEKQQLAFEVDEIDHRDPSLSYRFIKRSQGRPVPNP